MSDFKLEAIKCKNCGSGLVVEVNDYVTYCISCGSGFEIINGELNPIEINFSAAALPAEGEMIYKPFWLLKTHVEILERTSSSGHASDVFGGSGKSSGNINFYIPAFRCPLESLKFISTEFTTKNPVASPQKFNSKLTGFAYGKEDAMKLAEFLLISVEAEKKDMLKTFRYNISLNSYEILGIPFYKIAGGKIKDAVLGITINTE